MVGRGFPLDYFNLEISSERKKSHVLILALILGHNTMLSSHAYAQPEKCRPTNFYHCGIYPDGVRNLDCFRRNVYENYICDWKPGDHVSEKTYTLVIRQDPKRCRVFSNIMDSFYSKLSLYKKLNVSAEVYENPHSANCTKAVFKGSPPSLQRCDPPHKATFSRRYGRLAVNVTWPQWVQKSIKQFSVRYKALGSQRWSESPAQSENAESCVLENLNAMQAYAVQIQCVTNSICSQCVWSQVYNVSSELTATPVFVDLKESDIVERSGQRLLTITWKFPANELHSGYNVTIGKASGEAPREQIQTTEPEITLILSYSAYHVQIRAVNNVSSSPALSHVIPRRQDKPSLRAGQLNVTVQSNTSFTIHWGDHLIQNYVCYSAEWTTGNKTAHMSFFEDRNNYMSLSHLAGALEPFKRYSLTLHYRPDKDTCNMKHVNNSESTYGTTQFYFTEGSPVSAPENITFANVTLDSVVLQWSTIPEEDLRGFLLGYIIHYSKYNHKGTIAEISVIVDPDINTYTLRDLESDTEHEVQVSGFTRMGEGVRSRASHFTTKQYQGSSNIPGIVGVLTVTTVALLLGSVILERVKAILWPSIPNPRHSNAIQKIGQPFELELLESLNTLKVEEGDTNSLQIVEKEEAADTLPLPLLQHSEDEGCSAEASTALAQRDDAAAASAYIHADMLGYGAKTDPDVCPTAFASGYTTMEMFQQVTPQGAPASTPADQGRYPEMADLMVGNTRLDYIRRFSSTSITDDVFTITGQNRSEPNEVPSKGCCSYKTKDQFTVFPK